MGVYVRALFHHQWTLREGKINGSGVMFGEKGRLHGFNGENNKNH